MERQGMDEWKCQACVCEGSFRCQCGSIHRLHCDGGCENFLRGHGAVPFGGVTKFENFSVGALQVTRGARPVRGPRAAAPCLRRGSLTRLDTQHVKDCGGEGLDGGLALHPGVVQYFLHRVPLQGVGVE